MVRSFFWLSFRRHLANVETDVTEVLKRQKKNEAKLLELELEIKVRVGIERAGRIRMMGLFCLYMDEKGTNPDTF